MENSVKSPLPINESVRLSALESYRILDTASDDTFDRITRLATTILKCPISAISFVDKDRQWFKSHLGLGVSETPRSIAFCAHTILSDDILVVQDTAKDERFWTNPLVTGEPRIRFYAGAPLVTPEGHKLGSLCAIDQVPRLLTAGEKQSLRDLAAIVMNELELRRLASIDSLTKAFNRAFFLELIDREIIRADRHRLPLSVLMIDVDRFKSLNDEYGHAVGDFALLHLAEQSRKILRAHDVFGRLGGEEFAVLLTHTDQAGAQTVAEKLRSAISSTFLQIGLSKLAITISVGVAQLRHEDDDKTMLLQRADQALYKAKNSGRNQTALAEPT